jgi:hypothetical protein
MGAARALVMGNTDEAQIVVCALEGSELQDVVGLLAFELERASSEVDAAARQLASVLREVAARCADDAPEPQAVALAPLLFHAHQLLGGGSVHDEGEQGEQGDEVVSGVVAAAPERAPSILPESGVVRRGTLRAPSEPGGSQPGVRGVPGHVPIAQSAGDFDDETEVTMPAITRMNVSVFDMMDDDETEHTLPGVAPPSTRRNGLRLG